jgi:hypothetical protein
MAIEEHPLEQRCASCAALSSKLPLGAGFAFVLAHIGITIQSVSRRPVLDALEGVGSGADLFALPAQVFQLPAVLTSLTAFAALGVGCIMAIDSLGWLDNTTKMRHTLRRLVGPFPVGVIELSAGVTFLIQLVFSYSFCIVCVLVQVFSAICKGGSDVIATATNLTALLSSSDNAPGLIEGFNMETYCSVASDASGSAVSLLVGTVLLVLGQAGIVACMSEYVGRVCQAAEDSSREPHAVGSRKPEAKPKAEPKVEPPHTTHDARPQSSSAQEAGAATIGSDGQTP